MIGGMKFTVLTNISVGFVERKEKANAAHSMRIIWTDIIGAESGDTT